MFRKIGATVVLAAVLIAVYAYYSQVKPKPQEIVDNGYVHDRWGTKPSDITRGFTAFDVSFDSEDDDDGDGRPEARGVAEWVAHEIKRFPGPCVPTAERPKWFSDEELVKLGVAPRDDSYSTSPGERGKNGYDRGHLAPKFIAARMGEEAEKNTHTLLNAVPQRHEFNAGIWLDLERLTGAWAQRYGRVWVVTGPVFTGKRPSRWLGERRKNEFQVAIPDALFKIVVRQAGNGEEPEVLAFLYPQEGEGYAKKPFDHRSRLVSVDSIENATGLDFLTILPDGKENRIEAAPAASLWPVSEEDFLRECRQQ